MRDYWLGISLITVSIAAMITYFWALFLSPDDYMILGRTIQQWALVIPTIIIVFLFLFILAWIGWAMATTPPELPIENQDSEE